MDEVKKSGDHVIGRSQNELDPKAQVFTLFNNTICLAEWHLLPCVHTRFQVYNFVSSNFLKNSIIVN
jgi:hypothetical protein